MCVKYSEVVYDHISVKNFANLPDFGWWYYCNCGLPTYNEDHICNTCKRQEKYS